MLSPCWAVGGVERQFVAMAQEIKSVEWAGIVATGEPFERNAIEEAMRICPVEQGGEIEVRRLLERCDAVIAWGNLDARHWFEGWKGSLILVAHGTGQYTRERMADLADLAAYRVAVSEAAVATFPEQFRPTVRVVHNGFEYGHVRARGVRSRDQVRAAWKIPDGKLVIGYCGRFSIEKNPTAAAMAAAALGWEYCVAVYQVPGWSRPDALSALPGAFPGGDFRFPGETPTAVQEFLAGVDVLILASREEGFSMAMVEAWASRTPVVSTVVGAIEEVERDHGRVVVRVPHNPTGEDLAAAVEEALSDEFREGPVENAYRVAWDSLTAQSMARRWNDVFREIPLRV
jgi:glycosyltransferase involved in cell wall biosynthesis